MEYCCWFCWTYESSWLWLLNPPPNIVLKILVVEQFLVVRCVCVCFPENWWRYRDIFRICGSPTPNPRHLRKLLRWTSDFGGQMKWVVPPGSWTFCPLKIYHPKRRVVVFQPSFFRGELLNFGRVTVVTPPQDQPTYQYHWKIGAISDGICQGPGWWDFPAGDFVSFFFFFRRVFLHLRLPAIPPEVKGGFGIWFPIHTFTKKSIQYKCKLHKLIFF